MPTKETSINKSITLPQLAPRGAELYCIKKDKDGNYVCEGKLCKIELNGPCKSHDYICVSSNKQIPVATSVVMFNTIEELNNYKTQHNIK